MKSVKLQAALDLARVAGFAALVGLTFALSVNLFGIALVMIGTGLAGLAYCFYQLFQIRCEQIEMTREREQRVD
jgi:hypothetical protein